MRRVLCAWLPDWPIQRLYAVRSELRKRPVVLYGEAPRGGFQVVHCSPQITAIAPGMPLAEARALVRTAHFEPHDHFADSELLRELALRCQRFSPLVGLGEEASLLLEMSGCVHLFGGEPPLIRELAQFLSRGGFVSRIALADTVGAAWADCRYGAAGIVPPGENESALEDLPVAALRLSASIVETLLELGIPTIGALRALPRGSLTSRFGASVVNRLDQAFGHLPEVIIPVRAADPIRAERVFDEPVTDRRSVELALHGLLEPVAEMLRKRQLGVQKLTCRLDDFSFEIGTTSPTDSVSHLWELVRLHLERLALPEEVTRLEVHATLTARRVERQSQIIVDERIDNRDLRLLLDRLKSRLGEGAVLRPQLVPDPLPEAACRFVPLLQEKAAEAPPAAVGWFRPLRMQPQPIAVEVVSVVPEGPPIRFRWKNADFAIHRHWGPERIASGWWRGPQVHRDYYRVEVTTGERFWLFRTEGRWFLHGVFE